MRNGLITATITLLLGTAGCGTNPSELFFQTVDSAGRAALDLWLTQITNDLADSLAQDGEQDQTDGATTNDDASNDNTNDATDDVVTDSGDPLTGDAAAGAATFAAEGCTGCHCDDATGGCALDAPSIVGVSLDVITEHMTGDATHPTKPALSAQDLADLEAFLASP